jgi:tetratricopeptide (TPR) repeat protein
MRNGYGHTISPIVADEGRTAADGIPAADIHSQLDRILDSAHLRGSLRLTRFLRFVVETALAGRPESIKAYTVAVEALGRGCDFDPQHDPIVRVEAGRLRQALAHYYGEDGHDDPLIIELPRGTYVPRFHRRETPGATPNIDKIIDSSGEGSVAALSPDSDFDRAEQIGLEAEELFGRAQQFGHNTIASHDLAAAQRSQMAEISDLLKSMRRTLTQSRSLLGETDKLDDAAPGSIPASPEPLGGTNAEAADTAGTEKAQVLQSPIQPVAAPRDDAIAVHSRMRRLLASAAGGVRANAWLIKISLAAIAILSVLEVMSGIDHSLTGAADPGLFGKLWPASNATITQPQGGEAAPIIDVAPLQVGGMPPLGSISATGIRDRLIDFLSRFDDVTMAGAPLPDGAKQAASESAVAAPSVYRLEGSLTYNPEEAILVILRLIDMADGTVVWSKAYHRSSQPNGRGVLAGDVARSLLGPFGVIEARERIKRAAADPMRDTYRCVLDAAAYLRSFDSPRYQPVSECLVRASTRDAPPVTVFADLALVYLRNYRFGISGQPGDPGMLDNAYRMATRAVDIKPDSAFAQLALQGVLLAKGDTARAIVAGDEAFRLNPNDSTVAFGRAWLLVMTGRVDQGVALLNQNAGSTPTEWLGYRLLTALGYYLEGDLKTAAAESAQIADPAFPPGLLLDAVVADKTGDRARARRDVAMLAQFYPAWHDNPRASLARLLPDRAMSDRIAGDFESAVATSVAAQ